MTEIRKRRKRSGKWSGILLFFIFIISCESTDVVSISQISPKSNNIPNISERVSETVTSSSSLLSSPTKFSYSDTIQFLDISPSSTISSSLASSLLNLNFNDDSDIENIEEHQQQQQQQIQSRIQRSALPILNDLQSKSNLDLINSQQNDVTETAGRYFNYIKPTSTVNNIVENGDITKSQRNTKDNNMDFLSKRGPRLQISGPLPINPTTVIQTTETVISTNKPNNNNNNPRQNHNPDIQDIITGIVKLLNGNVNVHANTQAQRRPVASRINNRGPPRISEAQPLPIDYDVQKPNNSPIRPLPPPPPYPFDRPDNAVRPFVSGIPIPEQIVPSIQQNYRPSFISQNRPPWHRPRPRPPFGSRRPIAPYKPLPHQVDNYNPDEELQITTVETDDNNNNNNETIELNPTDSTNDGELLNLEKDESSLSVTKSNSISNDNSILNTSDAASVFVKKDEHTKKKDNVKHKSTEKKPIIPITKTTSITTDDMTTIIQSTSVVHTAQVISSTMEQDLLTHEMIPSLAIETSIDDISSSLSSSINSEEESMTVSSSSSSSSSTLASTTAMKTTPLPNVSSSVSSVPSTSSSTLSSVISNTVSSSSGTTTTTSSITTTSTPTTPLPISASNNTLENSSISSAIPYHPRPGIVLDDPEFKPGGHGKITQQRPQRPIIQPTRHHHHPPAYGEIFDVTLSAIQGPGSLSGSQQTINIKPYGFYGNNNGGGGGGNSSNEDIIISPSGDEGFVSIDGKRTYINLFGELTDTPIVTTNSVQTIRSSQSGSSSSSISSTDYITHSNSELPSSIQPTKSPKPHIQSTQKPSQRPHYRPRTTQPPVRIDTCIVGDDSTCDQAQNEKCKTENGVSSCHCRPGYSRRKHREPCRRVVSFFISMRVDRIYERRIVWDKLLMDKNSEPYDQLSFESVRAIDSAMSMTPFSDEFIEAKVNNIYRGDISQGTGGVFVNLTLRLEENAETLRQNLRNDIQKHLIGVLHRRNNNIGNSVLYVDSPIGSISNLHDLDECQSKELNDCHINAICTNMWGSFRCECEKGYRDPWSDQQQRAGKECLSCPESHCNNRGICNYEDDGTQTCTCTGSYYGSQCEIDGEVLGVAIGASVAAVIIIVLTLICLIMWSRKWHREQKNTLGSPIFGYMTTGPVKSSITTQSPYQVTLDDRMRWAQIADVMAQANHYAAEPVAPPRPSSAMFGYPNLQAMNMGTMGGMSIAGTLPMHSASSIPPVPLPRRLGLSQRSNGMRTLENSSSSEEEDRTDLLGRNFQVPRPKSRSNGSIANQSGIYYDVDYEPSGGVGDIYGTATTSVSNTLPGSQGIPMSTYTSGRTPSAYYIKR